MGVRVSIWGAPLLESRRFPAAGAVVTRRRVSLRDRSPERRPGAFCSPPIPVAGWKVLSLAALASPSPFNNGGKRNRGTGQLAETLFRVTLPPRRLVPLPPMCRVGDLFNYLPGFTQIFGSAPYRNVLSATFFFFWFLANPCVHFPSGAAMCLALQFGCACPLCALRAGSFAARCACRVVTNTSGRTEPPLLTVTERASLLNCRGVVLFCF